MVATPAHFFSMTGSHRNQDEEPSRNYGLSYSKSNPFMIQEFMFNRKNTIRTRQIILDALLKRLKDESLLSESKVKHIQMSKALEQTELYEF